MEKIELINIDLVLKIYEDLMEKYNSGGMLRDSKLLESAIYGVKNYSIYNNDVTICDLAAAYCFYLCQNHAFTDGNKRIAFFTMAYFLRYHGFKIIASPNSSIMVVKKVAQGEFKIIDISNWLKENIISLNNNSN